MEGRIALLAGSVATLLTLGPGCGEKLDATRVLSDAAACAAVTYEKDVKAVFEQYCVRCHSSTKGGAERNGAPATANFDSYQGAAALAETANNYVQSEFMPPVAPKVAAEQKVLLRCWVEQGKKER